MASKNCAIDIKRRPFVDRPKKDQAMLTRFWNRQLILAAFAILVSADQASADVSDKICATYAALNSVVVLVHKPTRQLHVIRSGHRLRQVTLPPGSWIKDFPAGVFSILRETGDPKLARMRFTPNSQDWTISWLGKPLFAEGSMARLQHGAGIYVPKSIAVELAGLTKAGAVLVVANSHSSLGRFDEIGLYEEPEAEQKTDAACRSRTNGWESRVEFPPAPPVAMVLSERDRTIYIFEGGVLKAEYTAYVRYPRRDTGRHVYVAIKPIPQLENRDWLAISLAGGGFEKAPPIQLANDVLDRFSFDDDAQDNIDAYFKRGVVLLITERSVRAESRSEQLIPLMQSR